MQPLPAPVPMTDEEKKWMMTIYELRYKDLFFKGFFRCLLQSVLFPVVLLLFVRFGPDRVDNQNISWQVSQLVIIIIGILLVAYRCASLYFSGILPYHTDAISGMKQPIPFTILQKEYFPITDQYFFRFTNDPDTHFEVNEETYNKAEEGSITWMYRAIHSQHILRENDHIQVRFFVWGRGSRFDYQV